MVDFGTCLQEKYSVESFSYYTIFTYPGQADNLFIFRTLDRVIPMQKLMEIL